MKKDKIIIGITGNIGGGKSTVSKLFEDLGATRISSDDLAKIYTGENSPIKNEIISEIGPEILNDQGFFDRKKIAEIVFNDKTKLEKLNKLIHPLVRQDFWKIVENSSNKVIAWEVPLLFETDAYKSCDFTLSVISDDSVAIQRVRNREIKLNEKEYQSRSSFQLPIQEKVKLSDFIIENNGSMEELIEKVKIIYTNIKPRTM